jgi:hypothetical protein
MSKIKTLYLPEGAMYPFDTEEEAKRFLIEKELRKQGQEELKVFLDYISESSEGGMVVDVYTLTPRFIEAYNNLKQIVEKQSVVLGKVL